MQYLPYTQEQTWGQTYGYRPGTYIETNEWPVEDLPMTYQLGNSFWGNVNDGNYLGAAGDIAFLPFTMLADSAGHMLNTAANGYKRAYNYGANVYNNVADAYNNWQMQRDHPQTSLTGRKLTFDMNPAYYNQTIAIAEKPKQYLVGADGNIVAEVKDPYPYVSRVVQAQQLGPSQEERRNMMPVAAVQSN